MIIIFFIIFSFCSFISNAGTLSAMHGEAPTLVGYTTATYNGDLGGFPGANQKCQSEFSGTHMCSASEVVRSGVTIAPLVDAWVFADLAELDSQSIFYSGCWGYSTSTSGNGVIFSTAGSFATASCATAGRSIACCK